MSLVPLQLQDLALYDFSDVMYLVSDIELLPSTFRVIPVIGMYDAVAVVCPALIR